MREYSLTLTIRHNHRFTKASVDNVNPIGNTKTQEYGRASEAQERQPRLDLSAYKKSGETS